MIKRIIALIFILLTSVFLSGCDNTPDVKLVKKKEVKPASKSTIKKTGDIAIPMPLVEKTETILDLAPGNKTAKGGVLRRIHSSTLFDNNKVAYFEEHYVKSVRRGVPDTTIKHSLGFETANTAKTKDIPMAYPYSLSAGPYPGRLTLIQTNGHSWDINSIDPKTGIEKDLYNTENKVVGAYWGNKGKTLLIYEQKGPKYMVKTYDLQSKRASTVLTSKDIIHDIAWHPDGRSFAYSYISQSGEKGIRQFFIGSKRGVKLVVAPKNKIIKSLTWHPNGKLIAFAGAGMDDECGCESVLGLHNLSTNESTTLKGFKITEIAEWSSDGRFILAHDTYLLKKIYLK